MPPLFCKATFDQTFASVCKATFDLVFSPPPQEETAAANSAAPSSLGFGTPKPSPLNPKP